MLKLIRDLLGEEDWKIDQLRIVRVPKYVCNSIQNYSFSEDFEVLEGWKSSGRPVEKMSTKFRLKWSSWWRVMTRNPNSKNNSGNDIAEICFGRLYPVPWKYILHEWTSTLDPDACTPSCLHNELDAANACCAVRGKFQICPLRNYHKLANNVR